MVLVRILFVCLVCGMVAGGEVRFMRIFFSPFWMKVDGSYGVLRENGYFER